MRRHNNEATGRWEGQVRGVGVACKKKGKEMWKEGVAEMEGWRASAFHIKTDRNVNMKGALIRAEQVEGR